MKGSNINSFVVYFLLFFCAAGVAFGQESASKNQDVPVISDVVPREISQGMFIKVAGYKRGEIDKNQFIFSQNGRDFVGQWSGGWSTDDNFADIVKVPEGLAPGICQLSVGSEGRRRRSSPFTIEVATSPKPPRLTSLSPVFVNPGKTVSVSGIGFSEKDTFELIDAEGRKYSHNIETTSTDGSVGFLVPEKAYSGLMTLKIIENRSGRASNPLTFEVIRGAVPLTVSDGGADSLAPGQWFEPSLRTNEPLTNATKVEFFLKQGDKEKTAFVTDFKRIRFQIPKAFSPGVMEFKTRTWIKDEASPWSPPVGFNIAAAPRKPVVFSFQIVPSKGEALFMQDEKAIVAPLYLGVLPTSLIPEKITDGTLQIFTRYRDKGKFSGWKLVAKYDNFSRTNPNFFSHPEYEREARINFNSFYDRVNIRYNSPEFFEIELGQNLRIYGDFYVESVDDLRVTLENSNRKISLKPKKQEFDGMALIEIPEDLQSGDWKLSVINKSEKVETLATTKLRIK